MKALTKYLTGAAAAAALAVTAASPAQAQRWDRDDDRIDIGDVAAGVAILGGVAAVIAALDGGNDRYRGYNRGYSGYNQGYYGYDRYGGNRYGNRYGYGSARAAVNVCARHAQRIGRNVQITDLDRTNRGYRVRGRIYVADYDRRRDGWGRSYRARDWDRESFTCYAANGRIYDFNV